MTGLTSEQANALKNLLLPVADDEWVIGHRGSEWLALTPDLEEDLAISSISQDEMGHAELLYRLLEEQFGEPSPDRQVFFRHANDWRHARLLALTRQDWAEWVVRRYFYEIFDDIRRQALQALAFSPLLHALQKIQREEVYHSAHFETLMSILAEGGEQSRTHLENAVAKDWSELADLFGWGCPDENWRLWNVSSLAPDAMTAAFESRVQRDFASWGIPWPGSLPFGAPDARHVSRCPEAPQLLQEMREVRQLAPNSVW